MDIARDKTAAQIVARLKTASPEHGPVKVEGTWGSFAPMLAAHISKTLKRPILYLSGHIDDADNVSDDLHVFAKKQIQVFSASESESQLPDATDEIQNQRIKIALDLAQQQKSSDSFIISTCVQALLGPIPKLDALQLAGLNLSLNTTIEPELIVTWLDDNGFERVDKVDVPGQFAQRGGIVDIYAPVSIGAASGEAVRIEFFGDTIESIRQIDLDTQRSSRQIDGINIIAPQGAIKTEEIEQFINILPADTIIVLAEPTDCQEVAEVFLERLDNTEGFYNWSDIYKAMSRFTQLHISRFAGGDKSQILRLNVKSTQQFEHRKGPLWTSHKAVLEELLIQAERGKNVQLYCENLAEVRRITEIVKDLRQQTPSTFNLPLGFIHHGFVIYSIDTIVVTHHEIFGQYALRRRVRATAPTSPIETFVDLKKGDYVVHINYGIGKFGGIQTMEKQGRSAEYLALEYAKKAKIYVPVQNIHLVQKYVGATPTRPMLSKIGTKKWERQKQKVAEAVNELAVDLLEIQAQRQKLGGIAFEPDSNWQREFEESFPYQETADQTKAVEQIKNDMQRQVPMDRLLCGDVGYGKTELAMRAAFKAVESSRQVAVLVPTTVLCAQHGRTFAERFADFPVMVEILNRFKTHAQAADIINRTKQGKVDILIGTHRLLSKDVGFKNLGLLIVDEEQRFGVEHKEKLKKIRINVDILTMTATPIPRTLHMSLMGLRDISSLATPPLDRRSIVTTVTRFDRDLIKKTILREMNRQGQVFFLHNRVQSIISTAAAVQKIVPKARIDIAHGQMPKHKLEEAMIRFVLGETDVLICSTIIESGLDIPNANTIIINDADRFGLAQLHQLRGRVGRYKHRAYAYMLLPKSRTITPIAAKRLKAIEEYSQLGAGFRIALRDLEIRGAGNVLGAEQSGHIHTVGYELYCKLLSDSVKRLKNEPIEQAPAVVIDLGFSTYIPKGYIPSDTQRMNVYWQIATAALAEDLDRLGEELADMFGPIVPQIQMLLDMAELKIMAGKLNIKSITVHDCDLIFAFDPAADSGMNKALFAKAAGSVRIPDGQTVHLRLEKNYFEPNTLMSILRKTLRKTRCD